MNEKHPSPAEIKTAREQLGLTQTEAAKLIFAAWRTWASYEDEGGNGRRMHPAFWLLFRLRTGLVRLEDLK